MLCINLYLSAPFVSLLRKATLFLMLLVVKVSFCYNYIVIKKSTEMSTEKVIGIGCLRTCNI